MEKTSQLILRNIDALPPGPALLMNPPRDTLNRKLEARGPIRIFTQDFGDFDWFAAAGADAAFGLLPWSLVRGKGQNGATRSGTTSPDTATLGAVSTSDFPFRQHELPSTVVFFLPQGKDRLDFLIHAIADRLPGDGTLWLVGENRGGIKSAGKRLQAGFSRVGKLDSARHCGLFRAAEPEPGAPFRLVDYREQWELELPPGLPGAALRIASLPGVFAHGRLDGGTAILLQYLAQAFARLKFSGRVLDFGCGAGVIGLALLRANPDLHLTLLDSSAPALTSAAWSLQANGFPGEFSGFIPADAESATDDPAAPGHHDAAAAPRQDDSKPKAVRGTHVDLLAADGLPAEGPDLDWIVSNPPFHHGVDTDLEIARRFFERAAGRLAKTGRLLLVGNRHLPYEHWLDAHFTMVEKPAESRDFKILLAGRPIVHPGNL